MNRFVTYITDDSAYDIDSVKCMTESEYRGCIFLELTDWVEWVWQYAPDKETAITQHFQKHDEWQANPNKETY